MADGTARRKSSLYRRRQDPSNAMPLLIYMKALSGSAIAELHRHPGHDPCLIASVEVVEIRHP
jgi:hypothetical protein